MNSLKIFSISLISIFCLILFSLPSFCQEYPLIGQLNEDKIHIRADSTVGSAPIGLLRDKERLEIIDSRYDWYKVNVPIRFSFYASSKYLKKVDTNKVQVVANILNLRAGPSLKAAIIGKAKEGDIFIIRKKNKNWLQLAGSSTTYGWVHKKFVNIKEEISIDSISDQAFIKDKFLQVSAKDQAIALNYSGELQNTDKKRDFSWNYFVLKGLLLELAPLKNCEAKYKLKGLYSTVFLKIDKTLNFDLSSFLNNSVKVEGRRKYGECSYIEVENIYLVK